jgi:hypothetical protein
MNTILLISLLIGTDTIIVEDSGRTREYSYYIHDNTVSSVPTTATVYRQANSIGLREVRPILNGKVSDDFFPLDKNSQFNFGTAKFDSLLLVKEDLTVEVIYEIRRDRDIQFEYHNDYVLAFIEPGTLNIPTTLYINNGSKEVTSKIFWSQFHGKYIAKISEVKFRGLGPIFLTRVEFSTGIIEFGKYTNKYEHLLSR